MRKILEYLLESLNFEIKAFSSFIQIDLEDQHILFDVVLTDILFDGISPIEFVVQMQESISTRNLIIVTNMGQHKIQEEILSIKGVAGFYGIPLDLDYLETQLHAV